MMKLLWSASLAAAVLLGTSIQASAQGGAAAVPPTAGQSGVAGKSEKPEEQPKANVSFNHKTDTIKIFDLDLEDGQEFLVEVLNTCPEEFDYPYVGVPRAKEIQEQAGGNKPLSPHRIRVIYESRFGGYVFAISRKSDVPAGSQCQGGADLKPGSFIVSVREKKWAVSFSGGFTFSGLTSPVFGLRTENNVKRVFRESAKDDERKLGAASFVHAFHESFTWKGVQPALAFGLGINSDNGAEYFIGGGLRLGDVATINGGLAFGSVARLPNGVTFETPVTDDNVLNNLGNQVVRRYFVAVSFAFIDTKDKLKKPFAADAPAAPAVASTTVSETNKNIVQTVAGRADIYSGIEEMKGAVICRAEVSGGENNTVTVTLHFKDASVIPKVQPVAVAKRITEALSAQVKSNIKQNPPTVKDPVAFGQTCS